MPGAKSALHKHTVVHTLTHWCVKWEKCGIHKAGLLMCIIMRSFWITLFVAIICLWKQSSGLGLLPAVSFKLTCGEKTKQNKENNFFPVRTSVYSRKARAFRMKNTIGPGWELYKSGWHRLHSCPPFLWTWAWPWHIEGAVPALLYLCTRVQLPKTFLKARETWNSSFGTILLLTWILEPAESDLEAHLKFNK